MPDINMTELPGDTGATPVTSTPSATPAAQPSPSPAPSKSATPKTSFADALSKIPEFKPVEAPKETPQDEPEAMDTAKTPDAAPDAATVVQSPKAKGSIAHEKFEKLGNDLKAARAEIAAKDAKIKEAESKGKNTDTLETERETLRKELDATKAQLAQYNPAVTEEFKKQFDAPFDQLKDEARASLEYFRTINPETGEQNGPPATWEDFQELYGMTPLKAGEYAANKWGTNAAYIVKHVLDLKQLSAKRQSALDGAAKIAETKWKESQERTRSEEKIVSDSLAQFNQETIAANPEIYNMAPAGEDDEGNAILQEGIKEVANRGQTPQEYAKWLSTVQLRAAAFPRITLKLQRASAKVAELEGVIAKMKGLSPSKGGKPSATAEPAKPKSLSAALANIH